MGKKILNYTREPINEKLYDKKLADSMHLAIMDDDGKFKAMNHNSGILFVKATENEDGSLNPKSLKAPWLFQLDNGEFAILAIRTLDSGETDPESVGAVILFMSKDLVSYEEIGLLYLSEEPIKDIFCQFEIKSNTYELIWTTENGTSYTSMKTEMDLNKPINVKNKELVIKREEICTDIEGAIPQNIIEISDAQADYLYKRCNPPVNTGIEIPKKITVSTFEELQNINVKATYSDGSCTFKRVDWENTTIDFDKPGTYQINGHIHQEHFDFPVAFDRADPCIGEWNGKFYFIATNDADQNHTLYIREADTIKELVHAEEHLILDSTTFDGIGGLLWAPEFHVVNDKLYIFHAATRGEFFYEESHIMELKDGGNPICKEDWSAPKRIVKKDGSELCEAGKVITLDMTCFLWQKDYYVIWSQRQFLPKDLGAWLYIAKLNPLEPWKLLTDPIVLSKPEYGWANNHTFVDEGPFALCKEDKLYVTFSSAAVDTSYVVGLLSIEKDKDLLTIANWKKENFPILTSRSVKGEFGTGHNAYVIDQYGDTYNTYHARPGVDGPRSSGIRRVHFDFEGTPRLDVTEEMDVLEQFRDISTTIEIL